jgi:uncharacterized protein (TIGR00299 family) protein
MNSNSMSVGWLDCSSGVSGDMLLGALSALGAVQLQDIVGALHVDVDVNVSRTRRGPLDAMAVDVRAAAVQPHRRLPDVQRIIDGVDLPTPVKERATAVFRRLAVAEASVHGRSADQVEFHEVGAVDAIVDIVGVCAGFHALGLDELVVSPIALGGGRMQTAHGRLPVPGPAVLELLRTCGLPAYGSPVDHELATPTGVALLAEWANSSGPMPAMTVTRTGIGAGSRELPEHPNVVRLVVGEPVRAAADDEWQVMAANVDDLDPRLWPGVIDRLLSAGAVDAWLTPILMKKGRPAHTVQVMCAGSKADGVRRALFEETSTIGVRTMSVGKHALDREFVEVDVGGQSVQVKLARLDGEVVNVAPEFDDVVRAAAALGRPVKAVLAAAASAANDRIGP